MVIYVDDDTTGGTGWAG